MIKLLHLLPPETAHSLTLLALRLGLSPTYETPEKLRATLFGKTLRNPIGLSGGADKEAAALAGWSKMGFGLVEAGTVTLKPRTGNPQPRIWRMPNNSIINWLGLPGGGIVPFIQNLKAFNKHPLRQQLMVGASIASPDGILDEFKILAASCAPLVDYITLNASCPNTEHGIDHVNAVAVQIRAAKDGAGKCPVLIKLGPTKDKAALSLIVKAAMAAGVDGFVASNTIPHSSSDLFNSASLAWPRSSGNPVGGYSGPALLDISCWMVSEIRALVGPDMPIIGVGGVQSSADAQRLLRSGANAIQLYTGLIYKGAGLVREIGEAI